MFVLPAIVPPVQGAGPRDDLLRLVPDDVGFCLVVQDLRGESAALSGSAFASAFLASPLGHVLSAAPEMRKLAQFDEHLQAMFKVGWPEVRDEILGDAVVMAYRPGPPGKPEEEQGVLLIHARDPKLLARLLERLNALQKQSGDLRELEVRRHLGQEYSVRLERNKGREVHRYYYLNGPVLAFTSQEPMLQRVIELAQARTGDAVPFVAEQLHRLGADDGLAALWVNPRAFDRGFEEKAAHAEAPDAQVIRNLLALWKGVEGIALTGSVRQADVGLSLSLLVKPEGLPAPARKILSRATEPSGVWNRFPEKTMLTVGGDLDAMAVADFLGGFLNDKARGDLREGVGRRVQGALGRDLSGDVLPYVGPDWGLCVAAPPPESRGWFPHVILAVQVRAGNREKPLPQALFEFLNSAAMLATLANDQLALKTAVSDQSEIKYLTNLTQFPPGLQPAFALHQGFLVLGSSPEAVRRFGPARASGGADRFPALRLSFVEISRYLKEHREGLAAALAAKDRIPPEEAGRRLGFLESTLRLFDRVELTRRSDPGRLTWVLRLTTAQPLK